MLAFTRSYPYRTICYCCSFIVAILLLFNHAQAKNQNGEDLDRERKSVDSVSKELLEMQAEKALKVVSAWKKKWNKDVLKERLESETLRKIISDYVGKLEELMDLTIVLESGVEMDGDKGMVEKQEGNYLGTIQELKKQLGFMEKAKDEEAAGKLFLKCIRSTSILLKRSIKAIKDMNPGLTGRFFAGFLLDNIINIGGNNTGVMNISVDGKEEDEKEEEEEYEEEEKEEGTTENFYIKHHIEPCYTAEQAAEYEYLSYIYCPE